MERNPHRAPEGQNNHIHGQSSPKQVDLGEILIQRLGNTAVDYVFPGVDLKGGLGLFGDLLQFGPSGMVLR